MEKQIKTLEDFKNLSEDKLRAAYALNMCTVSVSQIVDYNDVYILEQEYDAILNNLNLEMIPKDEALLKILTEILNTITFFKIQDIKKAQLEKEYQQRIKNAIWSAIPSISAIVVGNPIAVVAALATQVGCGYMNYRKEKCNALSDKEKSEVELQITAIEQLNALRRELFTTAWRLADTYGFPDCLRLTEKQIKQYNNILMDQDEVRKYARLEAVQSKFYAYPPFWYYFAHTALSIATNKEFSDVKEYYLKKADEHFKKYIEINRFNILREDQLTASANLEYVDLLLLENNTDYDKMCSIIDEAKEMAGNANDILQLCAIAYLKIGKSEQAADLLKILVNEEYNTVSNAKILSRLYVSTYIKNRSVEAYSNYKILSTRTDPKYLFPMPDKNIADDKELEEKFVSAQKNILISAYRFSITAFAKQKDIEFNSVIPAPNDAIVNIESYYDSNNKKNRLEDGKRILLDSKQVNDYTELLRDKGFQIGFIDVLNSTVLGMEELKCFNNLDKHDRLIHLIEGNIRLAKKDFDDIQDKLKNNKFEYDDYKKLIDTYSFEHFTEDFFKKVKNDVTEKVKSAKDLKELEELEYDLASFCEKNSLPSPEEYTDNYTENNKNENNASNSKYFAYDLLCKSGIDIEKLRTSMLPLVKNSLSDIVLDPNKVIVLLRNDNGFDSYFENTGLKTNGDSVYLIKQKSLAVIDDKTKKDYDLILCVDGIIPAYKNQLREIIKYDYIDYCVNGNNRLLKLGYFDEYQNDGIDISKLFNAVQEAKKIILNNNNR